MFLCLGTTPAVQRVMIFRQLTLDFVNRAATTLEGAAGKSLNVAKVLKTVGALPLATGFLGGDRGDFLRSVLEARGIETDFVAVAARTRQCTTVIDEAAAQVTELVEESPRVAPADYERLAAVASRRLPQCRALVLSGTLAPGGSVDFYRHCVEVAAAAGVLAAVDAQGPPLLAALKAQPGLVKPNRAELAATVGRDLRTESDTLAAMCELRSRGAQRVVVTNGKHPALAFDGTATWRITSPAVAAVNPIGSGDAFTAALVWRLTEGDDLGQACRWGAAAGAANALGPMPGDLEVAEVKRLVNGVVLERV